MYLLLFVILNEVKDLLLFLQLAVTEKMQGAPSIQGFFLDGWVTTKLHV
jgi:hypothetical protein